MPKNWEIVPLGKLIITEKGKKPKNLAETKSSTYNLPYIDIQAFEKNIISKYTDGLDVKYCNDDDILMVWDGARSGLVGKAKNGAVGSTLVKIVFFEINKNYIFYFLKSKYYEINSTAKGAATPHVDPNLLLNYPFPLPSITEQNLIVEKLDEIFSEINNGIENLTKAKEQLKIYRQSLLKDAFEGKLTEDWREKNQDKIEDAEILLKKIKQEREEVYNEKIQEWETLVNQWTDNGNAEKKPAKPKKNSEVGSISLDEQLKLNNIPTEWKWVHLGEIFFVFVGATPRRNISEYWNGNINWISSSEVAFKDIIDTKEKITNLGLLNSSTEVHPPNTVMLGMIGEGKTRGQSAILKTYAAHNQNTAAIRLEHTQCSEKYLYYYLIYTYEQTRKLGSGNNQKALNKSRVELIQFPLCDVNEQNEIVKIIESKFTQIEIMEGTIDIALSNSEFLIQSTYKKAFSGELVDYDINDLSVKDLINKIKVEKKKYLDNQKIKKKLKPKKKVEKLDMEILEIIENETGWIESQKIFNKYDRGNDTETVEIYYLELKKLLNENKIEVKRESEKDYFRRIKR